MTEQERINLVADATCRHLDDGLQGSVQMRTLLLEEHSGDCTHQPWTCLRCMAEHALKAVKEIDAALQKGGYGIGETAPLSPFNDKKSIGEENA